MPAIWELLSSFSRPQHGFGEIFSVLSTVVTFLPFFSMLSSMFHVRTQSSLPSPEYSLDVSPTTKIHRLIWLNESTGQFWNSWFSQFDSRLSETEIIVSFLQIVQTTELLRRPWQRPTPLTMISMPERVFKSDCKWCDFLELTRYGSKKYRGAPCNLFNLQ
jgi:hypothetical protein